MHYSGIKWTDTANGVGIRLSLFVSGCGHGCPGCFNPEAWDFESGDPFTPQVENQILEKLGASYLRGLSLLGGEPLAPANQKNIFSFLQKVKATYPQKDIWCYSGYLWEDLVQGKIGDYDKEILNIIDILVDGLFIMEKRNFSLRFRGSENQRIIQVSPSLDRGEVQLWQG